MNAEKKLAQLIGDNLKIENIQIDNFVINYAVTGSGPNLLLLHGINIGWGQWYPNIGELSKHFKVYAIDLPGSGRSTNIDPHKTGFEQCLVDTVHKFINAHRIEHFSIIGHSLGAWMALKLVLSEKLRINKIVLVSPLGFSKYTPLKYKPLGIYIFAKLLTKTVMRLNKGNIKKFTESVFHDTSTLKEEFIDYYYESLKEYSLFHPFLFINRLAGFLKVRKEFVLLDRLEKINKPTLVILGEKDPIVSFARHKKAFALIPGAKVELFLNTGHVPFVEKSDEFNKLVINFLKIHS